LVVYSLFHLWYTAGKVGVEVMDWTQQRIHLRTEAVNSVGVTVVCAPGMPDLEGRIAVCRSIDHSVGGMQICLPFALPKGTSLKLTVSLHGKKRTFTHDAKVMWTKPDQDGSHYFVGLRLRSSGAQIFTEWINAISRKGAKP